jgi:hypothetical protein
MEIISFSEYTMLGSNSVWVVKATGNDNNSLKLEAWTMKVENEGVLESEVAFLNLSCCRCMCDETVS